MFLYPLCYVLLISKPIYTETEILSKTETNLTLNSAADFVT